MLSDAKQKSYGVMPITVFGNVQGHIMFHLSHHCLFKRSYDFGNGGGGIRVTTCCKL